MKRQLVCPKKTTFLWGRLPRFQTSPNNLVQLSPIFTAASSLLNDCSASTRPIFKWFGCMSSLWSHNASRPIWSQNSAFKATKKGRTLAVLGRRFCRVLVFFENDTFSHAYLLCVLCVESNEAKTKLYHFFSLNYAKLFNYNQKINCITKLAAFKLFLTNQSIWLYL